MWKTSRPVSPSPLSIAKRPGAPTISGKKKPRQRWIGFSESAQQRDGTGRLRVVPKNALPAELEEPYDWNHHLAGDTSRIRDELGYQEKVSSAEAMRRSVRWEMG